MPASVMHAVMRAAVDVTANRTGPPRGVAVVVSVSRERRRAPARREDQGQGGDQDAARSGGEDAPARDRAGPETDLHW